MNDESKCTKCNKTNQYIQKNRCSWVQDQNKSFDCLTFLQDCSIVCKSCLKEDSKYCICCGLSQDLLLENVDEKLSEKYQFKRCKLSIPPVDRCPNCFETYRVNVLHSHLYEDDNYIPESVKTRKSIIQGHLIELLMTINNSNISSENHTKITEIISKINNSLD
jgi:hypothetical protein